MSRTFWRAFPLYLLVLCLLGWGAWEARAQTNPTPQNGSRSTLRRGRNALLALGQYLPQVAFRHGQSPDRLSSLLLSDPDLAVDESGALLYTCVFPPPPPKVRVESLPTEAPVAPLATSFQLHSRPASQRKIFLDFDGHVTSGTWWNTTYTSNSPIDSPAFSLDGDPTTFNTTELTAIQTVWMRVAEDFAPFDVDVTTEDPGMDAIRRTSSSDSAYGVRVVITKGASWYPEGGGVGYVGTFDSVFTGNDLPCFVFYDRLDNTARYIAEAASHETGHTLGLNHDGKTDGTSYYEGHGDWAPIMGVGYYRNVTQWSKGEYPLANNKEDDLALIQSNGALIRTDDHGNTMATATVLNTGTTSGVISSSADQDVFKITVGAGLLRLDATTAALADGPNLDISLHLYDGQNHHLAGQDSDSSLNAALSLSVPAGTYYAVVSGSGNGNVLTTGYSNYASIGSYTLTLAAPPFNLTAPNGGEVWSIGATNTITWTSTTAGNVKLEYSVNGGSTWSAIIASTPNDGSHNWTIPSTPSTQARVRISLAADSSKYDTSDANFTILDPLAGLLTVTAPNGGETWQSGSTQTITWTSSNVSGNVKLEYSTNAGSTWTTIQASTANDGSEAWTVPAVVTTQARVRVSSVDDGTIQDSSNANFSIQTPASYFTLTAPNGGESWNAGTLQTITWNSFNVVGNVKLEYSTDAGATWITIQASTANDGTETWVVPSVSTSQARVRVSSVGTPAIFDQSDANFTLVALSSSITVISPNGGESWTAGTARNITWNSTNVSGNIKLEYSTNGGADWITITSNTVNDGTESWPIPNVPTTQARVRISSVLNSSVSDVSNANFTILAAPASITLTAPNGGENWIAGTTQTITWSSVSLSGNVKLEYSTDGGVNWTTVLASTADDGSEDWIVPNTPTLQAQVRVTSTSNPSVSDTSDATFTIAAPPAATVTVTSPNGGESWTVGSQHTIRWSSSGVSGAVRLEYYTGSTWTTISANTANDGSETWVVPNAPTTLARVRVTSVANVLITDTSDAAFTIQAPPPSTITVTSPNGGEVWNAGSSQLITWTSTNVTGPVRLEYSLDGGTTWSTITDSTPNDQSEPWILPSGSSEQALIRIRSADGQISDTSDGIFTVRYQGGKLKAPKKGNFGKIKLVKTKTIKVVLNNTLKTGNLHVNVSISGAPFRIVSGGGFNVIPAKKKLTVLVIMEPSAVGTFSGTLFVSSSDPANPSLAIPLTGKVK